MSAILKASMSGSAASTINVDSLAAFDEMVASKARWMNHAVEAVLSALSRVRIASFGCGHACNAMGSSSSAGSESLAAINRAVPVCQPSPLMGTRPTKVVCERGGQCPSIGITTGPMFTTTRTVRGVSEKLPSRTVTSASLSAATRPLAFKSRTARFAALSFDVTDFSCVSQL